MNIEFNQANLVKGVIFTFVYLTIVGAIALSFFSFLDIADYFGTGSLKLKVIVCSFVIMLPVVFLIKFATDRGSFVLKNGKIYIEINKKKSQIDIQQVGLLVFNDGPKKTLKIFAQSGQLFETLCPVFGKAEPQKMLQDIIAEISKHIDFKISTKNEKSFGQEYLITFYSR